MKKWKFIVKITISAALVAILFYKIDIEQFIRIISKVGAVKFLILSGLYISSQIVSSIRWHLAIRSLNENIGIFELLRAYFIGMYANLFLPSIIGGDAIKAYILAKKMPLSKTISSIFLERYNGLLALLLISLISVSAFHRYFNIKLIIAVLLINIGAYASVYSLKFLQKNSKIALFYNDIALFHKSRQFLSVSLLSLLVQIIVISVYAIAGYMLGFKISIAYYFAFIPIINLISFLPISFNGIGVREFSFVFLFKFAGLCKIDALSLSLEVFFVTIFCSLIGGIIYLSGKYDYKTAKAFYKKQ
jgi:uncharacterized membrane protein YbhN (UPF0104 family)